MTSVRRQTLSRFEAVTTPMQPSRTKLRRPLIPQRARYPVWSVRTITFVSVIVLSLTTLLMLVIEGRSLVAELEIVLTVVAACLLVFLTIGLYRGVRVRRKDTGGEKARVKFDEVAELSPELTFNAPDCPIDAADEGCLGSIAGLIVSIIALWVIVLVLWFLLNVAVIGVSVLALGLYWIFYLALRQVFAKSRRSRGNLKLSAGYALYFTVLYTGWLFALLIIVDWLLVRKR